MSKLSELIRRAGRVEAGPIGFGVATQRRPSPTMLCLLRLDRDQARKTDAAAADAVIVTGVETDKLADAVKKLSVPFGVRLKDARREAVAAARDAGADFVILDGDAPAEALLEENVGLVLSLAAEQTDSQLRTLAGLGLDGLEVAAVAEPFSVDRMLEMRRLSLLSQTPLFIEVPPDVNASRAEALRSCGAAGLILDGRHADKLSRLRETVLSLPPRGRRREERAEAVLPSLLALPHDEEEEEPEIE